MIKGPWPLAPDETHYEIPLERPIITPMYNGARVALRVSNADYQARPNEPDAYGIVTDLDTNKRYRRESRPCMLSCHCDAEIFDVPITAEGAGTLTQQEVDDLTRHLDDETEWQTQNEFYDAWSPRLNNRLQRLLKTARTALVDHDGLIIASNAADRRGQDRVKELEAALSAAVEMLSIAEWPDEASEQARLPGLSQLRGVLRKGQARSLLDWGPDGLYDATRATHLTGCHAAGRSGDGECRWRECPQLKDGEPAKSGRHCPLDVRDEEE
jgi:hypothetical protein